MKTTTITTTVTTPSIGMIRRVPPLLLSCLLATTASPTLVTGFLSSTTTSTNKNNSRTVGRYSSSSPLVLLQAATTTTTATIMEDDKLYNAKQRDAQYGKNVAQYLIDLHDAKATFNFCGGMMFQLVLSDALHSHLSSVAKDSAQQQPILFSNAPRMFHIPDYEQSSQADNIRIFHGREIRKVQDAAGGMGMVLQLSLAADTANDPQGWTAGELADYDGWGHDSGRVWRNEIRLAKDGFPSYATQFGPEAFGLHHRFYLHLDSENKMWLSAEDGCEGTPQKVGGSNTVRGWFSGLF
jgi:hypothetical protein